MTEYKIELFSSIHEISKTDWTIYVQKRFFLHFDYLRTLEIACPQLNYRYAVVRNHENEFLAVLYFQIIPFEGKNLYNYLPSDNRWLNPFFKFVLSKIHTNLLVLGNVVFTCENGLHFPGADASDEYDIVVETVHQILRSYPRNILATMLSRKLYSKKSNKFCPKGFHNFRVEDRMEIDISSFDSFEDYTQKLQSKYRVRMNKVISQNQDLAIIAITALNFELYRNSISNLFNQVLNNSKFKLTELDPNYFYLFLKNKDRFKIDGFVHKGELVGFISYFDLDTILEVHYIGMDYNYNHTNKFYNFMLYHILGKGIVSKQKAICYGRTAQELKSTIGALPFQTHSSLKINNPLLNVLTPLFLNRLLPAAWSIRSPFKES